MLGIGVITFNRRHKLEAGLAALRNHTRAPFELVIADDGSSDDTAAFLRNIKTNFVTGTNRGVSWNKNRALFFLREIKRCDPIILLEDDTTPIEPGWEQDWVRAAMLWGHVNLAFDRLQSFFLRGTGSVTDPIVSTMWSGQCTAFSSEALSYVGYLDTRFKGFGYEHGEHTRRFLRQRFGGEALITDQESLYFCHLLASNLRVDQDHSFAEQSQLTRNKEVLKQVEGDLCFRPPWRTDAELRDLRREISEAQRLDRVYKDSSASA